jgi:hypothetical protein
MSIISPKELSLSTDKQALTFLNAECPVPVAEKFINRFGAYPWHWISKASGAEWQTETRYPLSPNQLWEKWQDPSVAVGVRFGATTSYGLIDIDRGSTYWGKLDPVLAALESLGLVRPVLVQSSASGGIHIYFSFPDPVGSFDLASALAWALHEHGVALQAGQCEIFPNLKAYGSASAPTEFHGHRLPMQVASCLLSEDLQPIPGGLDSFLDRLEASANFADLDALAQGMASGRKWVRALRHRRESGRLAQWRADLEADIAAGFIGEGMKHTLLGKLCDYGYVFLHLEGPRLREYALAALEKLPGYHSYARPFLSQIKRDLQGWLKKMGTMIQQGRRFMAGAGAKPKPKGESSNGNEAKQLRASNAIREGMRLIDPGAYRTISALAAAVQQASGGVSFATLYKAHNLPLWHPEHRHSELPEIRPPAGDSGHLGDDQGDTLDGPDQAPDQGISGIPPMRGIPRGAESNSNFPSKPPAASGGASHPNSDPIPPIPGEKFLRQVAALDPIPDPAQIRALWLAKVRYIRGQVSAADPELVGILRAMVVGLGGDPAEILRADWDEASGLPWWWNEAGLPDCHT